MTRSTEEIKPALSIPIAKGEAARELIGAWRYAGTQINGANWDRGANPKGMIYYGPHGEMAVKIAPDVSAKKSWRGDDCGRSGWRIKGLGRFRSAPTRLTSRPGA